MIDAYMPDLRVYVMSIYAKKLVIVASIDNNSAWSKADNPDLRMNAIRSYVNAAGVKVKDIDLKEPTKEGLDEGMYLSFGTGWDVVKHDPRK